MFENEDLQVKKELFAGYYKEKILPILQPLERKRKKMLYILMITSPLVILWLIFAVNRMTNPETQIGAFYGLSMCFAILVLFFPMLNYYRQSKESLLPLIAGFFGDFTYGYQKGISEQLLARSKIIKTHDSLQTDDCFFGVYDNTDVSIMEYALYQIRHIQTNQGSRDTKTKSGGGVIFIARMNKKFKGQTIIVKDKGLLNCFTRYKNLQRVGLESPEFEKKYEVYSDDQIEARYLLTPVMLEYMLEIRKNFPKITYSFFDESIFINIETNKNLFECSSFFRSVINKKRIEQNFKDLYCLFSIIRILRLNQKQIL